VYDLKSANVGVLQAVWMATDKEISEMISIWGKRQAFL